MCVVFSRLVIQYKNGDGKFTGEDVIATGEVKEPKEILDLGLRHTEQISILQAVQDNILLKQSIHLFDTTEFCPRCGHKVVKNGVNKCSFNAVFTDHKVPVHRLLCKKCKWSSVPSVNSLLGTHMPPDLTKMQCEESSRQSYTLAQKSLNLKAGKKRTVNSAMTLHGVVDQVGNYVACHTKEVVQNADPAKELIVQVDGGHIKSKHKDSRSFEAITSVAYKPENIIENKKTGRGKITGKHCAASALDDHQQQIKALTLNAAKKEGMTIKTNVVALCDGAKNCWSVIEHLKSHCHSITSILDWFHIAMKFTNIGRLVDNELLSSAKWSLWHGNTKLFFTRIDTLISKTKDARALKKLKALREYILNNKTRIVNYAERKKKELIFTSNMAECTVESLINQRCKGKQHMQWSRSGVQPVLQIRAAIASNDWESHWEKFVLGAYRKTA